MIDLRLSKVIRELDATLSPNYQAGAYEWIDANFDGAWSKLVDKFEQALVSFTNQNDYKRVEEAAEYYKKWCLTYFKKFKDCHGVKDVDEFLSSVGK